MPNNAQQQLDDIYDEAGRPFRRFAVALLVVGLAALFAYRLASTDPSWDAADAPGETISQ